MYAVLFDIDGTLVQTGGAGQLAFAETFASEFGVERISAEVPFAGRSDRAIALELMSVHGVPATDENWLRFCNTYLRRLPEALERREGRILPGVSELLGRLADLPHVMVGLLTGNIREGARRKLEYYELFNHFGFGGFGDVQTDRSAIAVEAVAEAQRELAVRSNGSGPRKLEGVMVVGDTIHDVRSARAVGAVAVATPTGGSTREQLAAAAPDLLVEDLREADAILEVVNRRSR
jgi:phosphoglycolate phosphatase-like HAD superfamily hydrolase